MTKEAMATLFEAGFTPHITLHDELDFSLYTDKLEEDVPYIKEVMENCVKLKVPLKVDIDIADNWGECGD